MMIIVPIFPHVSNKNETIRSGSVFEVPSFCLKNKQKCNEYYESILNEDGFHTCPYGYASYVASGVAYTGLKITDYFNRKILKSRNGDHFSPVLDKSKFIEIFNVAFERIQNMHSRETKLNAFDSAMHEIRSLNADIKIRSERINFNLSQPGGYGRGAVNQQVMNDVQDIFAQSSLISARLNFFDFEVNPDLVTQRTQEFEVYKKFDKVRYCLNSLCRSKGVKINFYGNCIYKRVGYTVFDLLPFILLENAFKYSLNGKDIDVKFSDNDKKVVVTIESMGPKVNQDELEQLFDLAVRGAFAEDFSASGTGTGLYFARKICDLHGIDIKVQSNPITQRVENNIPFSKFTVTLTIPK